MFECSEEKKERERERERQRQRQRQRDRETETETETITKAHAQLTRTTHTHPHSEVLVATWGIGAESTHDILQGIFNHAMTNMMVWVGEDAVLDETAALLAALVSTRVS